MKARTVRYERVKSDQNWGNTRVGIELELEQGETAQHALEMARIFVDNNLPGPGLANRYREAERIVNDPDNYTGRQVNEARELLDGRLRNDELPF